jgi:hypothetical protein
MSRKQQLLKLLREKLRGPKSEPSPLKNQLLEKLKTKSKPKSKASLLKKQLLRKLKSKHPKSKHPKKTKQKQKPKKAKKRKPPPKKASLSLKKQLLRKLESKKTEQLGPQWQRFSELVETLDYSLVDYLRYLSVDESSFLAWKFGRKLRDPRFLASLEKLEIAIRKERVLRRKKAWPKEPTPARPPMRDMMGGPSGRPGWQRTGGGWHYSGRSGWRRF